MGGFELIWKSILLGTVQGLTEFLPVSSSGHLTLLQKLLHFDLGGGMFVNVMLHLGTLIAVMFVFRKDIIALFKKPFKTLGMLVVATVPAGIVGLLFHEKIDSLFSGKGWLLDLAVCFAVTAGLLLITEIAAKKREGSELSWRHTVPMGLMQAVALFPGISRSGSTIAAGTFMGAKKEDVARFSFLLSIPVILGSVLVEGVGIAKEPPFIESGGMLFLGVLLGVVAAAISGFFAIKVMMNLIAKANYKWFSLYLILLSMTCFWLSALGVIA